MNLHRLPELAPLLREADHVDVKRVAGRATLREFLAGMLAYAPGWLKGLYVIRAGFVRLLGMRQPRMAVAARYAPSEVPVQPGQKAAFFTVRAAEEDRLWLAEVRDRHLDAWLGVVAEPLDERGVTRFHVVTIVKYNDWSGPVYFNVIRPFHHLVVGSMARAGIRQAL